MSSGRRVEVTLPEISVATHRLGILIALLSTSNDDKAIAHELDLLAEDATRLKDACPDVTKMPLEEIHHRLHGLGRLQQNITAFWQRYAPYIESHELDARTTHIIGDFVRWTHDHTKKAREHSHHLVEEMVRIKSERPERSRLN